MKLIYLYHPKYSETKRVDIEREDGPALEAQLTSQGWSRKRFAQLLYHRKFAEKVFRTPEEVTAALKQGWQATPIAHPHEADQLRVAMLADSEHNARRPETAPTK